MAKIDKKKQKLVDRISQLENELASSLAKKDSRTAEIDVGAQMRKINDLKVELIKM